LLELLARMLGKAVSFYSCADSTYELSILLLKSASYRDIKRVYWFSWELVD